MALIKCSECLKEISENAKTCPHCGNPIKKIKPKKEKKIYTDELQEKKK